MQKMKKITSIILSAVLIGTVAVAPVSAQTIVSTPVEMQPINGNKILPVAYTSDFAAYSNVVGVLNSDGTKTAYIFASPADAAQVDSITGLISPVEELSAELTAGVSTQLIPVEDATVYSGTPTVNYGSEQQLYFGEHETHGYARTYMKFDLSALSNLSYKNVLSAYLCIRQSNSAYEPFAVLEAHLSKGLWNESSITWNNRPDYDEEVAGRATLENLTGNMGFIPETRMSEFYITEAVMAWLQGLGNNGLLIKEIEDKYINAFHSSECSTDNYRPYLTITYSTGSAPSGQGIYSGSRSYYIVNRATGTCLTAVSASIGADIQQAWGSANTDALQKWQFTQTEDGRYLIELAGNSLSLSNATSAMGDVCLGDGTLIDNNLWEVERNWNGTYRFYNDCSTYYKYLYAGTFVQGELANIYQYNYSCDFNYNDEWTLVPADQGTAYFYGFTEAAINLDTTYGLTVIGSHFNPYMKQIRINKNAANGFSALQAGDLFYFSGHGYNNQLCFYEPRTGEEDIISLLSTSGTTNALSLLEPNALARQRLVFLSSCLSGGTSENDNMAGRLYQLGAHNVVSYNRTTTGGTADERGSDSVWNSIFMTTLMNGRTLGEAKERADGYLLWNYEKGTPDDAQRPLGNLLDRHDLGDDSYRTCFDMTTQATTKTYSYRTNFEYTHTTVYGNGNTSVALSGMPSITINKKYTLPINHQQETFDVYVDSMGATYWYYAGTDVLHLFEPYTGNLELGKTVVNPTTAMSTVTSFLQNSGYDTTGFVCETSNAYSKNFTVHYAYTEQGSSQPSERLIFHLQSDSQGNAYIKDFTAHHYGEFSQEG